MDSYLKLEASAYVFMPHTLIVIFSINGPSIASSWPLSIDVAGSEPL